MAAGLDYLQAYPYGCTEQRISLARAELALRKFRDTLDARRQARPARPRRADTIAFVGKATDESRAWYRSGRARKGYVSLTAWSVQFLVEARDAGYSDRRRAADRADRCPAAGPAFGLHQFISGIEYAERVWALTALAQAGKADDAYAAELARKTQWLNLEALAQVTQALGRSSVDRRRDPLRSHDPDLGRPS